VYPSSTQKLQEAIIQAFHALNNQTLDMKTITKASPTNCCLNLEFGVANADTFNFLDREELKKLENALKQQAFSILDFFLAARYHVTEPAGKRRSLKFDYHMLRMLFYEKNLELLVYHERGTQRIQLEDLVLFLKNQIDKQLSEKLQKPLILKRVIKSQSELSLQQANNKL